MKDYNGTFEIKILILNTHYISLSTPVTCIGTHCVTYKALNGGPAADSHKADVCYIFVYEESQEGEAVRDTSGADSTHILCTVLGGNKEDTLEDFKLHDMTVYTMTLTLCCTQ